MINNFTDIKFSPKDGKEIKLAFTKGVFTPNTTTELLINAIKKTISKPVKIGC